MAAAALPEDLILNILVRLPVKSLGRFRCVSKPWRTFINDPSFIRKHVDGISIENEYEIAILLIQFGLYGSRITSIRSMEIIEGGGFDHQHSDMNNPTMDLLIKDIDFPAETRSNWFKSSCDGILCTASSDSLLLWNPSIKEHKILPLSGPELCNSADEYGIGYDPSVDDYKVVRIPSAISLTVYSRSSIEIFTLKSNSWKKIPYNFPYPISQLSHGSFSNGAIYWVVRHALTMQTVIVCFHVMEEKFREVPLPDNGDNVFSSDSMFLQVLGGNLCLVHRAYDCFNIWAMKESWTKLTSSPLRVPGDDFKAVKVYCSPHIGILYVNKRTGEFGTYNLRDKTFRKLSNTGCSIADFHIAYVKTLVSPISC